MQDFLNKKIVLGICGGIAAYKSAYLVRELTRLGAEVRVVMTAAAQQFITPMTLQALSGLPVHSELFNAEAERAMGHIELARWADFIVIAPATANCLAKLAHGLADDLLSTICLVADCPLIVCPAMNRAMWLHAATQDNCTVLRTRGVIFSGPNAGEQACGDIGLGRMSEVEDIIAVLRLYAVNQLLAGRHVLITAGPTYEAIDPVRFIGNYSSGKMGYALAKAAQVAGAKVTLVSGPVDLSVPCGVDIHYADSAESMLQIVMQQLQPKMIFIGCAAVADYHVLSASQQKLKKQDNATLTLTLLPNADILQHVVESKKAAYVIGFSAETQNLLENATAKLHDKNVNMIVANQVGNGLGFNAEDNRVLILSHAQQKPIELATMHKTRLAGQIIAILAANLQNVGLF